MENSSPDLVYMSTPLWFNIGTIQSNISIHYTHRDWAVSSFTDTEGIWLLTATEQLWSIASINGISANATHRRKKDERRSKMADNIFSKIREHVNSGSVQALHTSMHQGLSILGFNTFLTALLFLLSAS